jgi:hypothetical protein
VHIFVGVVGLALALIVLWDSFETIILPRRVTRAYRLARLFYRAAWIFWSSIAREIQTPKRREGYLSYFGPLSLLMLFGMWAGVLIVAFGMMQWAARSAVGGPGILGTFRTDLYLSGTTFFTLGLGDIIPRTSLGRVITVFESGTGFGFLAIIVAYLPTLYGSFSQREVNISLLDARAGSPPTAAELLRRHGRQRIADGLAAYLHEWEIWSAQLMESHLTYPVLCYFRSQHENESWLSAFAAILDVCALLIAYGDGETKWQAQLTFAISRHAIVDLSQALRIRPMAFQDDRLPPEDVPKVRRLLLECGLPQYTVAGDHKLRELREMYEPYLNGFSRRLMMPVPTWGVETEINRDRVATAWGRITSPALGGLPPQNSEGGASK